MSSADPPSLAPSSRRPAARRARPYAWTLWILCLAALSLPWLQISVDNADGAGMLAHLHAFWTDGDLLYDDEYRALRMLPLFSFVTAGGEGVVSNHWPSGATWLQAPAYLLGERAFHGAVRQGALPAGALWIVASMALRCAAVLLTGAAAFALACLVTAPARRARARAAGLGTVGIAAAIWLGTPVAYYALEAPSRPHAWGFCATALLVFLYVRPDLGTRTRRLLGMGLVTGLAAAIRPQLAPLVLLGVHAAWASRSSWGDAVVGACLTGAAACVWVLPGVMMQLWIYDLPGSISGGVTHHFVGHFLTSPYHGVLPWHPLLGIATGLALIACVLAWRGDPSGDRADVAPVSPVAPVSRLTAVGHALLLCLLAHQVWLDAGYRPITPGAVLGSRTWAGGTGFGARKMVDVVPLLVPGVAALVAWYEGARQRSDKHAALLRTLRRLVVAAVALTVAWSAALLLAAFVDVRVTSEVLGPGSLPRVATLGLRGQAWQAALAQRAVPAPARAALITGIALPLLLAWIAGVIAVRRRPARAVGWLLALLAGYGLFANLHTFHLLERSEAALQEDPTRMPRFAAEANPRHAQSVGPVNAAFEARVRAVLGDEAVPPPRLPNPVPSPAAPSPAPVPSPPR